MDCQSLHVLTHRHKRLLRGTLSLSLSLALCLSIHLSICLSVYLSICLSVCLSIYLLYLSIYLSILSTSICLSISTVLKSQACLANQRSKDHGPSSSPHRTRSGTTGRRVDGDRRRVRIERAFGKGRVDRGGVSIGSGSKCLEPI